MPASRGGRRYCQKKSDGHTRAFARLQGRIEEKAQDAGIPVECVNAACTSQACHECGHVGYRDGCGEVGSKPTASN